MSKINKRNLVAFRRLIEKYESITMEDINTVLDTNRSLAFLISENVLNKLTGFGNKYTCTLCKTSRSIYCNDCLYVIKTGALCNKGGNDKTYWDIVKCVNYTDLPMLCKKRARHMRKVRSYPRIYWTLLSYFKFITS